MASAPTAGKIASDGKSTPVAAIATPTDAGRALKEAELPEAAQPDSCAICYSTSTVVVVPGCFDGAVPHGVCRLCFAQFLADKVFNGGQINIACPLVASGGCTVSTLSHDLIASVFDADQRTKFEAVVKSILYPSATNSSGGGGGGALLCPVSGLIQIYAKRCPLLQPLVVSSVGAAGPTDSKSSGAGGSGSSSASGGGDDTKTAVRSNEVLICGPTDFYHYDVGGEYDRGWGCAYRCIQMIVSNAMLTRSQPNTTDGSISTGTGGGAPASAAVNDSKSALSDTKTPPATKAEPIATASSGVSGGGGSGSGGSPNSSSAGAVPSIATLQRVLAKIAELRPADAARLHFSPEAISPPSKLWIEPPHAALYLRYAHLIAASASLTDPALNGLLPLACFDTEYRLTTPTGTASVGNSERARLANDLVQHFRQNRTPVMIDDATFSYVLCGIAVPAGSGSGGSGGSDSSGGGSTAQTLVLRFDPHVRVDSSQRTEHFASEPATGAGVQWMSFDVLFAARRWMVLYPGQTGPVSSPSAH